MCGHVGMMGKKLGSVAEDAIEDGLLVCGLRGTDSVGWAVVPAAKHDGTVAAPYVQKRLGAAPCWVRLPEEGAKVIIGHTRSATIGNATNRELAHPFIYDNILGAHNGTLRGDWRGTLQNGTNEVFGSDSQGVFYNFAYWGVEETIPQLLGAWCLVWWDDDDQSLNMLRNDERPLWLATITDGAIMWGSEYWMIQAMARAGEKDRCKFVKGEDGRFFSKLPVNTWRRYRFNEKGEVVQADDVPLAGAIPPPVVTVLPAAGSAIDHTDGGRYAFLHWSDDENDWIASETPFENNQGFRMLASQIAEITGGKGEAIKMLPANDGKSVVALPATKKGKLWRTVAGVTYVCKPGGNHKEIPFTQLLEDTEGVCLGCGTFIEKPEEIGHLADDYSYMACNECCKAWEADEWADLMKVIDEEAVKPPVNRRKAKKIQRKQVTPPAPLAIVASKEDGPPYGVFTKTQGKLILGTGAVTKAECQAYIDKTKTAEFFEVRLLNPADAEEGRFDNDPLDDPIPGLPAAVFTGSNPPPGRPNVGKWNWFDGPRAVQ